MPFGTIVKEKQCMVPTMPPGAFFKEEEIVPPMPPDAIIKQEFVI